MKRIDQLLTEKQLCKSRSQAQTFISQGKVSVQDKGQWTVVAKPSLKVADDIEIKLELDEDDRYVSRGALKLAGALASSGLSLQGFTVLDVGSPPAVLPIVRYNTVPARSLEWKSAMISSTHVYASVMRWSA